MNICVQGLWHLGTVTAACLASLGNQVTGLDFDAEAVNSLSKGIPPLHEPDLEALVMQGLASGMLRFSSRPEEAVRDAEVLWIAYDTPVDDDDNADIDFVIARIEKTLPSLPAGATVLISSQLPVGSVGRLEAVANTRFPDNAIGFACSPEHLRLGKALEVFLKPDRIAVGVRTARDREQGASVRVHDPVVKEIPANWIGYVQRFDEALDALKGAQVLLVGTEWPAYKEISADRIAAISPGLLVLDPNRSLSFLTTETGLRHVAVGTPSIERLA